MHRRRSTGQLRRRLLAAAVAAFALGALPSYAAPWSPARSQFASPRFQQVWNSTDLAVQQGQTSRSWTWGPAPWFDYHEFYRQSPDGLRLVQYFDKARMEINNPADTGGPLGGVTNGLLPVELVSGRLKLGDGIGPEDNEQRTPAEIAVAGDPEASNPFAPTYASFRAVATVDNAYRDPSRVGERAGATLTKEGAVGFNQDLAGQPGTEIVVYESVSGHNVPRVFEDFRNGLPNVRAIEAFGYPITDPYWVVVTIGNRDTDVLVQLYERRVLTYTPSNPAGFRVEMGNVGQHYFRWRYPHLGQPWFAPDPALSIVFGSRRDTTEWNIYRMDPGGGGQAPITANAKETLPFSVYRSWAAAEVRLFGQTTRYNDKAQIISLSYSGGDVQRVISSSFNDFHPAVSPDGTKLLFASDRDGQSELYLWALGTNTEPARLTETAACTNQHPSWLPDGSGIVWESDCLGNWEIFRGALSYREDREGVIELNLTLTPGAGNVQRLTDTPSDDRYPRVSPDGSAIAWTAMRDGNPEVYVMGVDGQTQTRLTADPAVDEWPSWSPDGQRIVFNSNRTFNHEIWAMNADGSQLQQLTSNEAEDGFALWAQ